MSNATSCNLVLNYGPNWTTSIGIFLRSNRHSAVKYVAHQECKPDVSKVRIKIARKNSSPVDKFVVETAGSSRRESKRPVDSRDTTRQWKRVNVRVIFARSCQPGNPCANKVPHRSSVRVRFSQWPFGKWRAFGPSLRGSNEEPTFCALKYRLIARGFYRRFYQHRRERDLPLEYLRNFRSTLLPSRCFLFLFLSKRQFFALCDIVYRLTVLIDNYVEIIEKFENKIISNKILSKTVLRELSHYTNSTGEERNYKFMTSTLRYGQLIVSD